MARKSDLKSGAAVPAPAVPVNARGEATLDLGSRKVRLKLTLGAMADLEEEFGIESLEELPSSATAIIKMLVRLAEAAGETLTAEELREADVDIPTIMATLTALGGGAPDQGNAQAPSR